jgi:hypothetical protein
MGRRKRDGNHSPPQNNLIQYSEGTGRQWIPTSGLQQNKDK